MDHLDLPALPAVLPAVQPGHGGDAGGRMQPVCAPWGDGKGGWMKTVCLTHYEMLENRIAELESTKTELEIALRDTLAALKRANADNERLTELVQQHQTYTPKEGLK
jgi:hypothetical protein